MLHGGHERSAMARDVGYLMAIIGPGGRGHVARLLPSVLRTEGRRPSGRKLQGGRKKHVGSPDVDPPEVEHRPAKLLPLRIGYDLVGHRIIIGVHPQAVGTQPSSAVRGVFQMDAAVILVGAFGTETRIAHLRIVEIVEGGHTKTPLRKGVDREGTGGEGVIVEKEGGHELVEVGRRATTHTVGDEHSRQTPL